MDRLSQKQAGSYYTPANVADSLLGWAIRGVSDRLLDPSCGDGQFIRGHHNSVGVEQDLIESKKAIARAPGALVHNGDFFSWALNTPERFECAAGNPPFIRYQLFKGDVRQRALEVCARVGVKFSGLASSWAPFLVATASLLKPGGRLAFVVPAEIGHAPYAVPLVEYLVANFGLVHLIAVRKKIFPALSEDCWLLFADGFGNETNEIRFTALAEFAPMRSPPGHYLAVPVPDWRSTWAGRLRPYLLESKMREVYSQIASLGSSKRFGDFATVGIGYVTGANDFFHLRPTEALRLGIPEHMLQPTVRKGGALPEKRLTSATIKKWRADDEQMLLLRISKDSRIPQSVRRYLDTDAGLIAREAFKCRSREPWYSVPDVQIPDFFLSSMSGHSAGLVRNDAACTCTNSLHSVHLRYGASSKALVQAWSSDFSILSAEIEGHPLGGGMLKLEPREATQILIPHSSTLPDLPPELIANALCTLRQWRQH